MHWVGHSMGGMIAYAYAIVHGGEQLHTLSERRCKGLLAAINGLLMTIYGY